MTVLELLKSMVAIPSVNPFRFFWNDASDPSSISSSPFGIGTEEKMNLFVEERLKECGFETSRQLLHPQCAIVRNGRQIEIPARWNVLGVKSPRGKWNGKSLLLFGHTDTVDVKEGWSTDPFTIASQSVEGQERWFGLGSNDMKGGLASILDAAHEAACESHQLKVAFVVDEEFYSFGAETLCRSDFLKDVSIALAPEIGDTTSRTSNEQWIGLGRLGRVEYEFEIIGNACHGADAFVRADAVNAVHESARLQAAIAEDCSKIRRVYSAAGVESLNSAFISFHHGGEPMLSVPDKARFILDRTLLPDESSAVELSRLQALVGNLQKNGQVDARAKITVRQHSRPTPPCQSFFFAPQIPVVKNVLDVVKQSSKDITLGIGRSVADENRIALCGIPTLTLGPSGAGSHTCQEWVDPQSVVKVAEIYRKIIRAH